ncbi:hypothetical protein LCGC14_2183480, partial [marine sediment metagenome]
EQPNCEGCEFFKHNNKYEHCWRYTQLTSVCKLRQDHKEQPPANDLTDWLRKTISGARYEKGDKELQAKVREACDVIDQRQEQPPAGDFTKEVRLVLDMPPDESLTGKAYISSLETLLRIACKKIDKAEAKYENKCETCVYLEADGEIINEHIDKHIAYDKRIKHLEAKLKAKDELLFAYESVKAPVNPLLAASKEMIKISRQVSSMAGADWLQGQLLLIDKTDDFEDAIIKAKQSS